MKDEIEPNKEGGEECSIIRERMTEQTTPKLVYRPLDMTIINSNPALKANYEIAVNLCKDIKSINLNHYCRFCQNPDSILTKDTCCTGCSKLKEKK